MIVDSLYPNGSTKNVGNVPPGWLETAVTHYWMRTYDGIQVNSPESYWMGYISKENLPGMYHTNIMYLDDTNPDNKKIVIKDLTDDDNFPCTYMRRAASPDYTNYLLAESFHTEYDGVVSNLIASPYRRYFFNQNYPEYSGLLYLDNPSQSSTSCFISALCYIYNLVGDRIYPVNVPIYDEIFKSIFYASGSTYIDDLYKFLYMGTRYTLNITFYDDGVQYSYDFLIKAEDIAEGTGMIWDTNNQVQLRFFIIGFDFGTGGALRDHDAITFAPSFMAKVTGHDGEHTISVLRDGHGCSGYDDKVNYVNNFYGENAAKYDDPVFAYGYKGDAEFNADAVFNLIDQIDAPYLYTDTAVCFRYDRYAWFLPYYNLDDVKRAFSLFYRVCRSNVDSYVSGVSYATDVTPDNEFLARLKTGNKDDPTFIGTLREWQYNEFTDNDFTEEDVPHPSPEPGGDDPGSDEPVDTPLVTGDDQELQLDRTLTTPSDFITMYNITPPMLTIFGRTLWKSIVDYDPNDPTTIEVFKNFFTFINESVTGSVDIGSLLQFVVSVRQYPFNVAGLGITQASGNSIKIGTGKFPLELGSAANVQKLTSTIGLLDCGTVSIADYRDFKLYNDFRDYLNTSVSAFLPYCGTVELNPIEVIHNTVHCYYAIDFYTGECTAYLTCTDENHEWICGIKNGVIGVLIPLTATNSGQISARHQSDNARDSSLIASTMGNLFSAVANVATGNIVGAVGNVVGIAQNDAQQRQMDAERQGRSAVMAPSLSGGSGAAAFYQPSCASILVRRGTYARDKIANYPSSCAYPATTSGTLSSFHGYTECYNVDVDKLNCNEEERAQVKMILETGVYLP